jgi:hypothetical protein
LTVRPSKAAEDSETAAGLESEVVLQAAINMNPSESILMDTLYAYGFDFKVFCHRPSSKSEELS